MNFFLVLKSLHGGFGENVNCIYFMVFRENVMSKGGDRFFRDNSSILKSYLSRKESFIYEAFVSRGCHKVDVLTNSTLDLFLDSSFYSNNTY